MPIKTSSGKWKWGNVERSSKKELVQTVYGIWKKNGSKGSFSDFLKGTHESVVSEDKAVMIKKLVLPDIEDEDEKKNYKWIIQSFFYKHPSYEKEIDWNKWKTLTKKDFDKVMDLAKTSRKARREKERMGFGKDPKELFKNVKGRKFKIVDENDSWLFVAPLNHEAAVFCDSKECGGGSATWCIGTKNNSSYWNSYISNESKFIMAFSKKFETMPEKELFSQLKYMFQKEDDAYLIWNQDDVDDDAATKVNQEKFKKSLQQLETLFSKVKDREYLTTVFIWSDEEGVLSRIFLGRKHYLKFTLPKNTEYIEDYATEDEGNQYDAEIDELVLNDSLKNIGVRAFAEISIKKISYSDNCRLDIIREKAFIQNYNIEELDLSRLKNPLTIDGYAFAYCKGLKSVKLPSNVLYLGRNIFDGCKNLRYLEIPKKFIDSSDNYKELGRICGQIDWDEIQIVPIDENGKKLTSESYEPPYTLDTIKQKYGVEAYRKLRDDPVHRFRAETGIEVIHKEPTRDEFERIVKNWDLMTPEQKKQSDEFSMKQFGNNNKNRIDLLRKEYDFKVGDKVKIRSGIRCRQSGHTGTIVRIDPPGTYDYDMHGWSSFIVKMDDPNLGTVGFRSGSIEKLDTVKEFWAKNGRYFYCDDCNKNMTKAPDDQYIMIDDDLWEYVCKHGGKKIGTEEDLCRDCIEKRLGRPLTLKDLGDKINLPINDEIKKMLKKRKVKESVVLEGKHWPEDYIKTAFNTIKNSELGKQSWYSDNYINQDLKSIVDEFGPLSHKNSNLGYFATIIKWFIAYAGKDKSKYQEFLERKLDGIIKTLLWLSNNPGEEFKLKEQIKTKWTFDDFEKYQKSVEDQISREQSDKLKNVKLEDRGYEIVPIDSYQELHEKFGGDKTGYKGKSEWCHTNGSSTYDSWTSGGKYNFFVLAKKDWEKIKPPEPNTTNAYDEYGTSLIAILVDVASGKLLNATLRWNHIIEPSVMKKGTSVDKAFLGWGDLAEVTGKDVEKEIKEKLKDKQEELQKEIDDANRQVNEYLEAHKDKIKELDPETNFKIIKKFKDIVTEIKIPEGATSIGNSAFSYCSALTSITIPDSVTNIGNFAFLGCSSLTSVTIPNNVTSIGDHAFFACSGLTSIAIPDNVTSLMERVFAGCPKLKTIYCSEKTWDKFRYELPKDAERKDPKEMKKESLNEAHEIHRYPEKLQPTLERIVKDNEDYELDHAYFNKEGKFIWMRNLKGYFHVFKPVKFVKTPGMTKPFGFKDLILKDNGMLEEVDRLRFADGNEGLKFLKDKYHLELKTIK